jgi:hypothetical protein
MKIAPFSLVLYMAKVHPIIWVAIMVVVFIRVFRNYGWRLERWANSDCCQGGGRATRRNEATRATRKK